MLIRSPLNFVLEAVTGTASASCRRIAALNHEVRDNPVECGVVVELFARQKNEIVHGHRLIFSEEIANNFAA